MGYLPANLRLMTTDFEGTSPQFWALNAVGDGDGTIVGANYISDGVKRGMKAGDIVDVVATGPKYKRYQVASLGTAAATLAASTAIT